MPAAVEDSRDSWLTGGLPRGRSGQPLRNSGLVPARGQPGGSRGPVALERFLPSAGFGRLLLVSS